MASRYIARTGDRRIEVTVTEHEGFYEVVLDGETLHVDSRGGDGSQSRSLIIDGRAYETSAVPGRDGLDVNVSGDAFQVRVVDELWARAETTGGAAPSGHETIVSPMPGSVVKVLAEVGATVKAGDAVVVVEAMKMQNELAAVFGGVVLEVKAVAGDVVEQDAVLMILGPAAEGA